MKYTDDQNELFDIVDENDQVIGQATRGEVHRNKNIIHRSIGVCVFNSKGEIYLQKRSASKDTDQGKWTISCSGHVAASGFARRQNFLARKVSRFSLISKLQYRIFQTGKGIAGFAGRQNFLVRKVSRSSSALLFKADLILIKIFGRLYSWIKQSVYDLRKFHHAAQNLSEYEKASQRELREELGVELEIEFVTKYLCKAANETEMSVLFKAYSEGPFKLHPQEIEEGKFYTQKELKDLLRKKKIELSFMGKVALTKIGWI